jgi:hypothetical protein
MQQNPQTGAFEPYTPPPAPSALDMLANLTGATDMQQAYQAAGRGEYLPALGQGAWGAGQAASLAVPALRSGMAAVRAGAPVAREMAGALPTLMRDEFGGFKLYHGSPYDFRAEPGAPLGRFRDEKIGTGEGNQAYAYGHYGAEAEPVAKGYKEGIIDKSWFDQTNARLSDLAKQMDQYSTGQYGKYSDPRGYELKAEYDRLLDERANKTGHMYELNINAEPEHFLDWDRLATEQPPNVMDALNKIWQAKGGTLEGRNYPPFADHPETTGEGLHSALATVLGSKEAAAAALRDAGVPGVRYLDAGSRRFPAMYQADLSKTKAEVADLSGALKTTQDALEGVEPGSRAHNSLSLAVINYKSNLETAQARLDQLLQNPIEGTSNYVMFDPALITILRKYGILGPAAGAGLLGAAEQQ